MTFSVFIDVLPPGINRTYKVVTNPKTGKPIFYKSKEAKDWETKAALIIGAKAGNLNWTDNAEYYHLDLYYFGLRKGSDVDRSIKIVMDTVSQKLGFNDSRILSHYSAKCLDSHRKGIYIGLYPTEKLDKCIDIVQTF